MAYLDETGLAKVWNKVKALVPTRTSQLTNDSGFLTQHQDISGKQNKLTAGENITIVNDVISATGGGGSGEIERGTSKNWNYTKYPDGTMIATRMIDATGVSFTKIANYMYYRNGTTTWALPEGFIETPTITVTASNGNYIGIVTKNKSATSFQTNYFRLTTTSSPSTSIDVQMSCIAVGKWK